MTAITRKWRYKNGESNHTDSLPKSPPVPIPKSPSMRKNGTKYGAAGRRQTESLWDKIHRKMSYPDFTSDIEKTFISDSNLYNPPVEYTKLEEVHENLPAKESKQFEEIRRQHRIPSIEISEEEHSSTSSPGVETPERKSWLSELSPTNSRSELSVDLSELSVDNVPRLYQRRSIEIPSLTHCSRRNSELSPPPSPRKKRTFSLPGQLLVDGDQLDKLISDYDKKTEKGKGEKREGYFQRLMKRRTSNNMLTTAENKSEERKGSTCSLGLPRERKYDESRLHDGRDLRAEFPLTPPAPRRLLAPCAKKLHHRSAEFLNVVRRVSEDLSVRGGRSRAPSLPQPSMKNMISDEDMAKLKKLHKDAKAKDRKASSPTFFIPKPFSSNSPTSKFFDTKVGRKLGRKPKTEPTNENLLKDVVTRKNVELLEKILSNSNFLKEINNLEPPGVSIFHQACVLGDLNIIKLLITKGADVHLRTWSKLSPLRIAAMFGHFEVAELLLNTGADPGDIKNGVQNENDYYII